jgi:hypothetical protein
MGPMMNGMRARAAMQPPGAQAAGQPVSEETAKAMAEMSKQAAVQMRRLQDETGTAVVGIQRGGRMARMMGMSTDAFAQAAYEQGIGVFPSVARAARTIAQVLQWREYRKELPEIL